MSYSIIFETKIVRLKNGGILHLDRSGCNNDNSGRKKDEFTYKYYKNESEYLNMVEKYLNNTSEDTLKLGNKMVTIKEYGEHLVRMLKRAKTWAEYRAERNIYAKYVENISLIKPYKVTILPEEFNKNFYSMLSAKGELSYKLNFNYIYDEDTIIGMLKSYKALNFYVGSKYKGV